MKNNDKECYVGCVARCRKYKLGVITRLDPKDNIYYGVGFDGKRWQSVDPVFISKTINDYMAENR